MMFIKKSIFAVISVSVILIIMNTGCKTERNNSNPNLDYCVQQAEKTILTLKDYDSFPRAILHDKTQWRLVDVKDWTSGFWPGILWYLYEYSNDTAIKNKAMAFSRPIFSLGHMPAFNHDLGFQAFCSLGNGYRITGDPEYKKELLSVADTLATLYNPVVGTILSWPWYGRDRKEHNTIIDNMINLELLFWASKNGGSDKLYDIAVSHANTTMKNHFRPDFSSYHLLIYDTATGQPIRKMTYQGLADSSMWARGQAWAIYGFTMCYRETKDPAYLDFAQKVADRYLRDLPDDFVPYWDFNSPVNAETPKDASAAAVTASALIELSGFVADKNKSAQYWDKAVAMLNSLSSEKYQSRNVNNAFLLHSTGHKPENSEIDASIIYADYYYLEALMRLKNKQAK